MNPVRCVYGDPACSLTVSTYLLGALTALVFAATLVAALYAKKTFEHERLAALSLQRCTRSADCPYEHRVFYIADPIRGFESREPKVLIPVDGGESRPIVREDWGEAGFDCMNVGKAPIVGAVLQIVIPGDGTPHATESITEVSVGSIASGLTAHLVFRIVRDLEMRKMQIVNAGHKIHGLEFFPIESELEPEFVFPPPKPEPPAQGPVAPPEPPPSRPRGIDDVARVTGVSVQHPPAVIDASTGTGAATAERTPSVRSTPHLPGPPESHEESPPEAANTPNHQTGGGPAPVQSEQHSHGPGVRDTPSAPSPTSPDSSIPETGPKSVNPNVSDANPGARDQSEHD